MRMQTRDVETRSAASAATVSRTVAAGTQPALWSRRVRLAALCTILAAVALIGRFALKTRLDAALADAVVQNNTVRFRELLDAGADPRGVVDNGLGGSPFDALTNRFAPAPFQKIGVGDRLKSAKGGMPKPRSILMAAVVTGNYSVVRELLVRGADPNYVGDNGKTAIFLCVGQADQGSLLALLKYGARVDVRMNDGQTPLHLAARANAAASIRTLIGRGADIHARDQAGRSPLAAAARFHSPSAAAALLDAGANSSDLLGPNLDPPLEWAATEDLPFFLRIWEKALPAREREAEASGALYRAVRAGNMPVVRFLLDRGPSVNRTYVDVTAPPPDWLSGGSRQGLAAPGADSMTVVSTFPQRAGVIGQPMRANSSQTPSVSAVSGGPGHGTAQPMFRENPGFTPRRSSGGVSALVPRPAMPLDSVPAAVKTMMAVGAPVPTYNGDKRRLTTLLIAGTETGKPELFSLLLDHGARPNARDWRGTTPLIAAVHRMALGQGVVQRPLLDDAAEKVRLAHLAAVTLHKWRVVVRRLLDQGADARAAGMAGETALMAAVSDPELVKLLIEHGADVNARGLLGRTALMWTGSATPAASVRLLIAAGARVNDRDNYGCTPLMSAIQTYSPGETAQIIRLLLDHGADPDSRDKHGQTALMLWQRIHPPLPPGAFSALPTYSKATDPPMAKILEELQRAAKAGG